MSSGSYYVVSTGYGNRRSGTLHLMQSWSPSTPSGMIVRVKKTLCAKVATRSLAGLFAPSEVTCRECKRRWQLATAQQPVRAARR